MMTVVGSGIIVVCIGLASGLAVGTGLVAFLVVLDVIPRLAQITRCSYKKVRWLEASIVAGTLFFTLIDFFDISLHLSPIGTGLIGFLSGCFVGMLAAALTEVLNVLPIMARRLNMKRYIILLLTAMVFGKICGSLFDWLVYTS